ncbi:MAG: nucleotidyl transferase AbiEii/AbiGii toxin family protein [bacterium]
MRLHLEILDPVRRKYLKILPRLGKGWYLAGGTALALQLGHRVSYDFDLFTDKRLSLKTIKKIKQLFAIKEVIVNNADELSVITTDGIKMSFVYYPFDLASLVITREVPFPLLSPLGVGIAKAYALNRRNVWRDYLDLYFILKTKQATLRDIMKGAAKVYSQLFSEKLLLAQLLYLDDITKSEVKLVKVLGTAKVSFDEVKRHLQKAVDQYLAK